MTLILIILHIMKSSPFLLNIKNIMNFEDTKL